MPKPSKKLSALRAEAGRKGGLAGKAGGKSLSSDQASANVNARWKKHREEQAKKKADDAEL